MKVKKKALDSGYIYTLLWIAVWFGKVIENLYIMMVIILYLHTLWDCFKVQMRLMYTEVLWKIERTFQTKESSDWVFCFLFFYLYQPKTTSWKNVLINFLPLIQGSPNKLNHCFICIYIYIFFLQLSKRYHYHKYKWYC